MRTIKRLLRWFYAPQSANKPPRRARPGLEGLEVRLTPTTYTWTNGTGNGEWADPGNWSGGDGIVHLYPTTGDDTAILTGAGAIKYEQNGLNVVSGVVGDLTAEATSFSGTLSLGASLAVDELFTWQAGTINFNSGTYTLDLCGGAGSTWTGGQIGADDSSATFKVDSGTTLAIHAPEGGSVTLGVPLVLQDAATAVTVTSTDVNFTGGTITVTVTGGTLEFSGGAGTGGFHFGPGSQASGDYLEGDSGNITFDSGAVYQVSVAVKNVDSTVQLQGGSTIDVPNGSTVTSSRSFFQTGGTTILGSTGGTATTSLTCDRGFRQDAGSLQTYGTQAQSLIVGDQSSTRAYFTGGTIKVGADLSGGSYGRLDVGGGLQLSGSTSVYVSVSLANEMNRTQIWVWGSIAVDDSSGSNQTAVMVSANGSSDPDVATWQVFASIGYQFTGQFALVTNGYTLDNTSGDGDYVTKV